MPGGSTETGMGILPQTEFPRGHISRPPVCRKDDRPNGRLLSSSRRGILCFGRRTSRLWVTKIVLELMCKCRVQNVREIPIHFATRAKGESKLSLKQQFRYLEHLELKLYDFTFSAAHFADREIRSQREQAGWPAWRSSCFDPRAWDRSTIALAYFPAIVVTAIFHARYVRTQREFLVRQNPWLDFTADRSSRGMDHRHPDRMVGPQPAGRTGDLKTFIVCFVPPPRLCDTFCEKNFYRIFED